MIIKTLTSILILLIVSNNISLLTDYLKIAGVLPRKVGKYLVATSMSIGLILEGSKMSTFVRAFNLNEEIIYITLIILILIFLLGNIAKLPTSATLSTVGVLIGVSLFYNMRLRYSALYNLGTIWILSPIISIAVSYFVYRILQARVQSLTINKIISTIATILLGYTFGVNTLGFLSSIGISTDYIQLILNVISIYLGSLFLSAKLGEEIGRSFHSYTVKTYTSISLSTALVLEIASNISIPVPLTALIVLSLLGPIAAKKTRLVNMKIFKKVILFWILTPVIAFLLTYSLLLIIHPLFFFSRG